MNIDGFNRSMADYEVAFNRFVDQFDLPQSFFSSPDHVAVKCADEADYLATCNELMAIVDESGIWEIRMDERLLASACLRDSLSLQLNEQKTQFRWIEIMQPRPGKELNLGFVEHVEFTVADLSLVSQVLNRQGIEFEEQSNPGHRWLNVVLDSMEREIKFNDKSLEDVAEDERSRGLLHRIRGDKN